ncbi:MAG: hypothetical protein ACTSP4_00660 [Candidatus Hodarchaeales archaeon]
MAELENIDSGVQTGKNTSGDMATAVSDIFSGITNIYAGLKSINSDYIPNLIAMNKEEMVISTEDRERKGKSLDAFNEVQIASSNLIGNTFIDVLNESSANTLRDINSIERQYQQQKNELAQARLQQLSAGSAAIASGGAQTAKGIVSIAAGGA